MIIPRIGDLSKREKELRYEVLLRSVQSLIEGEDSLIAQTANTAAVLKYDAGFFWVGFYFVEGNELVLGPFQGPPACNRIRYGAGVCGAAWNRRETVVVNDVNEFPGHISCNPNSKSEIVVPIIQNEKVLGVLDIDSDRLNDFEDVDRKYLEMIVGSINISS